MTMTFPPMSAIGPFDYGPVTRTVFGNDSLNQLGPLAKNLGATRVLLVSDPGIQLAGHVDRAMRTLIDAGLSVEVFLDVIENPTTRCVQNCSEVARKHRADFLVGLGGGSAMDTAKGANFLVTNGGAMRDYWGVNKASKPMLPMIAVPTTAGTGSEAQSFALISDENTHEKMACGDKKAAPQIAILDPVLTVSQPARVAAVVGIDAISHAIEAYVTTRRNCVSSLFAKEAWELLRTGFPRVHATPTDLDGRGRMLLGAHFAGIAIENSMLGATHSLANPLTARYGVTHGIAIGVMLPHVIRFNSAACSAWYGELLNGQREKSDAGEQLAEWVIRCTKLAGLPTTLEDCGASREHLPVLAEQAAQQWTARFNPRPVTVDQFTRLYEQAYNG